MNKPEFPTDNRYVFDSLHPHARDPIGHETFSTLSDLIAEISVRLGIDDWSCAKSTNARGTLTIRHHGSDDLEVLSVCLEHSDGAVLTTARNDAGTRSMPDQAAACQDTYNAQGRLVKINPSLSDAELNAIYGDIVDRSLDGSFTKQPLKPFIS